MVVDEYKVKFYTCSRSPQITRKIVEREGTCLLFNEAMMLTDIKERASLFLNSICFYFLHQQNGL